MYIFVENMTFPVWMFYVLPYLIRLRLRRDSVADKVYYIDASKIGVIIALLTSWLAKAKAEKLDFCLIDIRDEQGSLLRLRIAFQDLARIQKDIMDNPIYKKFMKDRPVKDSMSVFIEKRIANSSMDGNSLFGVLFLIHVVEWKTRMEGAVNTENLFYINKRLWMQEIKRYGLQYRIKVIPVNNVKIDLKSLLLSIPGLKDFLKNTYVILMGLKKCQKSVRQGTAHPKLAVEYYGHLNMDKPEMHSDLFFYQQSQLSGKDILITFAIPRDQLDEEKMVEIKRHGMETIVLNPKATNINSAPVYIQPVRAKQEIKLKKKGNKLEEKWLITQANEFGCRSNYWREFFDKNNIKVYISWYKYCAGHCAIASAIKSLGGVMSIYQRAFEELPSPETAIAADIVFGFAKENALIEKRSRSLIPYHVSVGYFGDHRFNLVREQAQNIRKKLMQNGAKRILAFFDENSADDSRWHTGHEFMRENYAFLLEKVLSEKWLGIVFKPKVPVTLRQRLDSVAELLKQAEKTGRCFVFEGGALHGAYPPAVAALASDVTIHGHLCAATAGVEAALAGVPTLLMDREGWPVSKLYKLGKGRVVFNNWIEAWEACVEHWKSRNGIPGFGDWSSMLDEIDPFRDGRAAERIGTYLKWLLDGFKDGLPREKVLADAADRYCKLWGYDKVVEVK